MSKKINRVGITYGRLLVISEFGIMGSSGKIHWNCICSCGKACIIDGGALSSGNTKSCGCFSSEILHKRNFVHGRAKRGKANSGIYKCWLHIKERCYNKSSMDYKDYGGRGIVVCDRWRDIFENFLNDMGEKPSSKHSIERVNVNGNYCPENCKWGTEEEQSNNKRNSRFVECFGKRLTVSQWSKSLGIHVQTILWRINNGRTPEQALFS